MDRVWMDYWDGDGGGLWDTARGRGAEPGLLPARAKPIQDAPTPSPNASEKRTFVREMPMIRPRQSVS